MKNITGIFTEKASTFGYKIRSVDTCHLSEMQNTIDTLLRDGLIDKHLSQTYLDFKYTPEPQFIGAKTVFVIAMPHPITRVRFAWHGKIHSVDIPPTYFAKQYDARAQEILDGLLTTEGYKTEKTNLPLKTLADRSGLANYGRNNISYVMGMGSYYRLLAFYSDYPCEEDNWQEVKTMKACEKCSACLENCPTGCIVPDRFLIHAERCLTFFNEDEHAMPDWIPLDAHNAIVGCMRCQLVCPVDKPYAGNIVAGCEFSEEETGLILNKTPVEKLPPDTRQKLETTFSEGMYPLLPRNLDLLINR